MLVVQCVLDKLGETKKEELKHSKQRGMAISPCQVPKWMCQEASNNEEWPCQVKPRHATPRAKTNAPNATAVARHSSCVPRQA
ncbi:hypothetical protein PIB30_054922 [Stylosanthes scabra]|uniref:Uncharacterized protein n=1 Tax=Stylosanthes scabra TaxID=79078 RepID=A0ABU6VHH4_9FABA|nr:hypothetical protein [Stylosanthes scabra]